MSPTIKERKLPRGLEKGTELRSFGELGYESDSCDSRFEDATPRPRVGLFLQVKSKDDKNSYSGELQRRAGALLAKSLPHVATPTECYWSQADELCFISEGAWNLKLELAKSAPESRA